MSGGKVLSLLGGGDLCITRPSQVSGADEHKAATSTDDLPGRHQEKPHVIKRRKALLALRRPVSNRCHPKVGHVDTRQVEHIDQDERPDLQ